MHQWPCSSFRGLIRPILRLFRVDIMHMGNIIHGEAFFRMGEGGWRILGLYDRKFLLGLYDRILGLYDRKSVYN
jgi:hypothetical protein